MKTAIVALLFAGCASLDLSPPPADAPPVTPADAAIAMPIDAATSMPDAAPADAGTCAPDAAITCDCDERCPCHDVCERGYCVPDRHTCDRDGCHHRGDE